MSIKWINIGCLIIGIMGLMPGIVFIVDYSGIDYELMIVSQYIESETELERNIFPPTVFSSTTGV